MACSYGLYVFFTSDGLENDLVNSVTPKKITDFETSRLVDVEKERLFEIMADIENYPKIFPKNVISVNILSKNNGKIIAEEYLAESGIKTKLVVKHTIKPYDEHIIEIIDGDLKGTKIIQSFESVESQTNLITNVHLEGKGITSLVGYVPKTNLIHSLNTVISHFVEYSKYDVIEKTVDSLYQEILYRSADQQGLSYYSLLLRNGEITEDDLRNLLLNSEERASFEMKTIDDLNIDTKNTINDLYRKILLRDADPEGMRYFGNILEDGTSSDEIRKILLESDEGKNVSLLHPVRSEIMILYGSILDRFPDDSELNYYHKMIDDGYMTIDDVKNELDDLHSNNK